MTLGQGILPDLGARDAHLILTSQVWSFLSVTPKLWGTPQDVPQAMQSILKMRAGTDEVSMK